MPTLPQLVSEHQQLADNLHQEINKALELEDLGEMQTRLQQIAQAELEVNKALTHKVNSWVWVIRRLIASAEYLRSQANYFRRKAQQAENAAQSMQFYLLQTLEDTGNLKFETADFKLSVRRASNPPVEIDNDYQGDIPDEYLKPRDLEDMIDKVAVKEALKAGKQIPFAKLGTPTKYIGGLKWHKALSTGCTTVIVCTKKGVLLARCFLCHAPTEQFLFSLPTAENQLGSKLILLNLIPWVLSLFLAGND